MYTFTDVRYVLARWIDERVIADIRRGRHYSHRAEAAMAKQHKFLALLLLIMHGYYITRADHRHSAANSIRPASGNRYI